jgi:hypothetical protein
MGLLDMLNSPAGIGLLSAAAGAMAGARRGQPWNTAGRGAMAGLTGYAQANDQIRVDKEKQIADQMRQMQMDEILRNRADKDAYRAQFKPAGQTAFKPDDPFGEGAATFGQDNLKTETPPMFAGQAIDPKLAAIAPFLDPKEMYSALTPENEAGTNEIKNYRFAQGLPEDQRAQFMAKSGGNMPSSVQEWEYFNKLDPQAQARFLEMKRNPQIMNLGGSQAVRAPGGGISEQYAVTPKITETPGYQAAQAQAVETAKAGVKVGSEMTATDRKADTDFAEIQKLTTRAAELLDVATSGKGEALVSSGKRVFGISDKTTQADASLNVIAGQLTGKVPRFEGPQSDADRILYQKMAGDVGNPDIPAEDRKAALNTMLGMHKKYGITPKPAGGVLTRGEILNEELRSATAAGDTQNANLIRQEMKRMGVKDSTTPVATKQATGTFKDPISVTNDDDFNRIPKGKYFKAPDGTIRVKP